MSFRFGTLSNLALSCHKPSNPSGDCHSTPHILVTKLLVITILYYRALSRVNLLIIAPYFIHDELEIALYSLSGFLILNVTNDETSTFVFFLL